MSKSIDLLLGGSPCQGFSSAGNELNFFDPRSKLFFDFIKAKEQLKPKYFLLENVKMKKEYEDIITSHIGVNPIEINSALVSAQNRVRLYWTNIPGIKQPTDKGINLSDILEDNIFINSAAIRTRPISTENHRKSLCLEVNDRNKSLCLLTVQLNNLVSPLPAGRYLDFSKEKYPVRNYTSVEMCRLQTLPDNYVSGYSLNKSAQLLGNAWTVDVIAHILSLIPDAYLQTVVSLFDGISCGQVALERAGKSYNQYYASEIEPDAMHVAQMNYPHTMQLGDVTQIDWDLFVNRLNMIQKVS
jgi:site-specific DNA-cytosine methylase